jgi:hypothetical protein
MYKVFFILLSLLFIGSADCKQFHDGIFVFHDFGSEFKIVRKGDKQIEYADGDEKIYEYTIAWESDCSYKLFHSKIIKGDQSTTGDDADTLYCKIVDIDKDRFKVLCVFDGMEAKTPYITKIK